jgi:glutaredoxin
MPAREATLYRLVRPEYVCPDGALARHMLEEGGFLIHEHILATQIEADAFAVRHDGAQPPLVFIGGERIGGCDELAIYLAKKILQA